MNIDINDEMLEIMKRKGIECVQDIDVIICDGCGNVIDLQAKKPEKNDMINHPKHYKANNGMEVIDVIEAFTANLEGYEATHTGNVIKYICRWKEKNGLEDLKKAQWYLNRLIKNIEENK